MAHFAHIDPNTGVVDQVIVIEQATLDAKGGWVLSSGEFRPKEEWVQTSYNTRKGVHKMGGIPLRKNYAGIGFSYDKVRDAFIPPKPFESWTLNEETCLWDHPKPRPDRSPDEVCHWDEDTQEWVVTNVKTKNIWRQ